MGDFPLVISSSGNLGKMKSFVLTILAFGIFATMAAEEPNLEQVLEQAEAEINQELLNRVMNGAQSRKFGPKKFTLA